MLGIQSTGQKDGFDSLVSVQAVGVPEQVPVGAQHGFLEEKFKFKCLQWRSTHLASGAVPGANVPASSYI